MGGEVLAELRPANYLKNEKTYQEFFKRKITREKALVEAQEGK